LKHIYYPSFCEDKKESHFLFLNHLADIAKLVGVSAFSRKIVVKENNSYNQTKSSSVQKYIRLVAIGQYGEKMSYC